jgi:2-polyprenyl-6-methoxyphenol hydroxylase-like FAD-dependent oxidoreductase
MTDCDGRKRTLTVPRGKMRADVWKARVQRAERLLPAPWADVVGRSKGQFVAAIQSYEDDCSTAMGGKVLLVGEAYTQFRPHLGLSSNLGALQALKLGEVLRGEKTMAQWEDEVAAYSREYAEHSTAMGIFGMTGKWPSGYVPLAGKVVMDGV